jgi:hypothetical protein
VIKKIILHPATGHLVLGILYGYYTLSLLSLWGNYIIMSAILLSYTEFELLSNCSRFRDDSERVPREGSEFEVSWGCEYLNVTVELTNFHIKLDVQVAGSTDC